MRRFAALLIALAATALVLDPASADTGIKATGHGWTTVSDGDGVSKRQFSFNAIQQSDGAVVGNAVLRNPAYDFAAHFRVECVRQDFPNQATIGAVVTKSNDPGLPAGSSAFWTVYDNGEPGTLDTISSVYFDFVVLPRACEDTLPNDFSQFPIEGGNIQVHTLDDEEA